MIYFLSVWNSGHPKASSLYSVYTVGILNTYYLQLLFLYNIGMGTRHDLQFLKRGYHWFENNWEEPELPL